MGYISAINIKTNNIATKKPIKKRIRGPRPRGPQPQVCDLCQIRKVKCDKVVPRCSFCIKMNKPCTYDRNGFSKSIEFKFSDYNKVDNEDINQVYSQEKSITKYQYNEKEFISNALKNSLINISKYKVLFHPNGRFSYFGPSMATYFFASSSHLFSDLLNGSITNLPSKFYNNSIQVDITKTVKIQLIELYFANLNNFFPLLNPISFYSQFNNQRKDYDFLALLSVVCLSGASYYPNRTIGRKISSYYIDQVQYYFKRIYLKPSLNSIQAYILSAYHISVCENNTVIQNAWYYLGLAKSMLSLFGVPLNSKNRSKFQNQMYITLWWMIFCCEAVLSYSFGRPYYINTCELTLPSKHHILPSVNITNTSIFIIKDLIHLNTNNNSKFFKEFCHHSIFLSNWSVLRESFEDKDKHRFYLSPKLKHIINNDNDNNNFMKPVLQLEKRSIDWYVNLQTFHNIKKNIKVMQLPFAYDIHLSYLAVLHFGFLIDINKPFINKYELFNLTPPEGYNIDLDTYYNSNCLEKCLLCAFFGTQVIMDAGDRIVEVAVPFFWYSALHFTFIFVYIIKNFDQHHWAVKPAKSDGLYLFRLFEKHADRWLVIKDAYHMILTFLPDGEAFFKI